MMSYDHKKIERKWQREWEKKKLYEANDGGKKPKFYSLIEFPYPSGDGLHVGHIRSNTAMDIISRKRRMEGFEVLYPIGWDAFGLPTENYAIKKGIQPAVVTKQNTDNFRRQLKALGFSFDWSREINTTDPAYYRWTQWIFLQFFKKGLAYKKKMAINWCPKDKIGLANEEVIDGRCERCGTAVEKREKEQWMLAITKYADRLNKDLDTVDFLERIKIQQRNWIGKSEGAEIDFLLDFKKNPKDNERRGPHGERAQLTVFTTRADTLFGATYLVLSPEHPWITLAIDERHDVLLNKDEVKAYVEKAKKKTETERTATEKEKTGVEVKGVKAINPATKEEIPMFVADYVLSDYGTGAIMAVPAHDDRDLLFAIKFKLLIRPVIMPVNSIKVPGLTESLIKSCLESGFALYGDGLLFNSGKFDGIDSNSAKRQIPESVGGRMVTTYKLRDWVFSRQRYWGEPIPLVYCEKDGWVAVPEKDLPVKLPTVKNYQPTDTGESPLAAIEKWVKTKCPQCKGPARRETDTMPNWAGSSWYYLRYTDPQNKRAFADKKRLKHWTPVDWYNGGMEHTTLHLLYSRFWHKFLFDEGLVPTTEPYAKRTSHGLILAEGGVKMSKSKGNVVNPDTLVESVGADSLRLYEMFMGPFDQAIAWSTDGVVGTRRFLERVWGLREKFRDTETKIEDQRLEMLLHQTIKKVSEDIEAMKFNTAISQMMIFVNECEKQTYIPRDAYLQFIRLLAPFAPHITEELWEIAGGKGSIHKEPWPVYESAKIRSAEAVIAVQVNGKVRGSIVLSATASKEEALTAALSKPEIKKWAGNGQPRKIVYIEGKILSVVF